MLPATDCISLLLHCFLLVHFAPPLVPQDDSDDDSASSSKPAAGPYRTDPKGDQLVADAAKKLKSFSFFGGNTKSDRYRSNAADAVDDAADRSEPARRRSHVGAGDWWHRMRWARAIATRLSSSIDNYLHSHRSSTRWIMLLCCLCTGC